jgi:hypothetical protein
MIVITAIATIMGTVTATIITMTTASR